MLLCFDFTRNLGYYFLRFSNINYNYGILMLGKENSISKSYSIQVCIKGEYLNSVQKEEFFKRDDFKRS